MGKPEFIYVTYIATTPEKLWEALTRGEFTKAYWYNRRIESEWEKGTPVSFFDGDSSTVTDSGTVLDYDPPRHLSYTFRPEFTEQKFDYTRVSFTLEPEEGVVKLTLVHDELSSEEEVAGWRNGWSPILASLKTYLETGKPLPRSRKLEEKGKPQKK